MRVAILGRYIPSQCGIAEYTDFLVKAVKSVDRSIDLIVLGNRDTGVESPNVETIDGVIVRRVFVSASNDYSEVLDSLKDVRPELLHIQHEYSFFPRSVRFLEFLDKARSYCKKIVITMHTVVKPMGIVKAVQGLTTFSEGAKEDFEIVMFQRQLGELCDAIFVHSTIQHYELWMQGVDPLKIHIVPHGTLLNPYVSHSKSRLVEELGLDIDPNKLVILLPGFVRPDKGLDILVKVFKLVTPKIDAIFIMGGAPQGAEADRIVDFMHHVSSLHRSVVFIDRYLTREELLKLLALSDIVALPYRESPGLIGVSGALHLAMGSFKPMVCTRIPKLAEYCEIVPELCARPEDPVDFASKLIDLVENLESYRKELEPVWKYAVKTSWNSIASTHIKLWKQLIES